MTLPVVLVLAASYLIGSLPAGSLIVRWYAGVDIRSVGSGNAGAMNVLDQIGFAPALLVAFVDMGKGAAAVGLAYQAGLGDGAAVFAGLLAVAGHDWSIFLRLRGGNGTASAVGALLVLLPAATLAAMVLTIAAWVIVRSRRFAGFVGLLSVTPIAYALREPEPLLLGALLLLTLVFVKVGRFEGFTFARRPR